MGKDSTIAWTTDTFNLVIGCQPVSPGCQHCYAACQAKRYGRGQFFGPAKDRATLRPDYWKNPHRWNRQAEKTNTRRRVFCGSWCDVFEAHKTVEQERAKLWPLIRETPFLDWLLLTKRPERITECLPPDWGQGYENAWLGVTAEDQIRADQRLAILCSVPARIRFVSYEPALEMVDFKLLENRGIHWLIVGGESGAARPFDLSWAASAMEQCRAAGIAFFMKQFGSKPFDARGNPIKLKDRHGKNLSEWPREWRIREFPIVGEDADIYSTDIDVEPGTDPLDAVESQLQAALDIVRAMKAAKR